MRHSAHAVQADILFVGLTRPPTIGGVPYTAFILEAMAATLVFLAVGNPVYLLLAAPLHAILYLISAHDPGIFHAQWLWLQTNGRCRNASYWGAASFSPLAVNQWRA